MSTSSLWNQKTTIICLLILIGGMTFGFFIGYSVNRTTEASNQLVEYEKLPYLNDTLYQAYKIQNHERFSPRRMENGMIRNAYSAAKIAYNYVCEIYGEYQAKNEQPYQIRLVNDEIWIVDGSLPPNVIGGSFHIALDKRTGEIIYIYHEK